MWIITKEFGAFRLDNFDRIEVTSGGTEIRKIGQQGYYVSKKDVRNIIWDAIRNGDNYVEVE